MLNDCLSSWCQTQPTAESWGVQDKSCDRYSGACAEHETMSVCMSVARGRCWGVRESLFSCLPAKIGADPLCSKIQIQVKFNPSYHTNPCQSLSQAARLTDLHFQHHGEHHNVPVGEEHTRKRWHTEQIWRKLLADDTSDSDLLLSDVKCYF